MRYNCLAHFTILNIFYPVFFTGLPDYFADCRVVYMRYFGEQVMFDLEVKSTDKPAYQLIIGSKVCGSLQLVNSPLIFHFVGFNIRSRESSMFNGMGKLEYNADDQPCSKYKNKIPDQEVFYAKEHDGKYNESKNVQYL